MDYKHTMFLRLGAFFAVLSFQPLASSENAVAAHPQIVPLNPPDLLRFVPNAPTGWEIKKSNAENYYAVWLNTRAEREFTFIPPVGRSNAQPQITRLMLLDTGYAPGPLGDFDEFKVGRVGNDESLMILGYPARRATVGNDKERLRIVVKRRFIVQIETVNQAPNSVMNWLKLFDLPRLSTVPDSGSTALPKPIRITKIDELNPRNNSTSDLFWSGP
jgi:hypothetical protein